jgi:hypothetical protein
VQDEDVEAFSLRHLLHCHKVLYAKYHSAELRCVVVYS